MDRQGCKSADAPREKRRRLSQLVAGLGLPISKVVKLVKRLQQFPDALQHSLTRWDLICANNSLMNKVIETRSLPLKPDSDGEDQEPLRYEFVNMGKLINVLAEDCPAFRQLLQETHTRKPSSPERPWHFILYFDETLPGNGLRLDLPRKFMASYGTFREFDIYLKHEAVWLPVSVVRTSLIKQIVGGWSKCLRVLMRSLLVDEGNLRHGVTIYALDNLVLFAKLGNLLADEDGMRQAWSAKGSAGIDPVVEVLNMSNVGAKTLVSPGDSYFLDLSCPDVKRFKLATDSDIWFKVDLLARMSRSPLITKAALKSKQIAVGMNHNPEGLLLDLGLRSADVSPMRISTHDATHIYLSDGNCHTEVDLLLPRFELHGITFEHLRAYFGADWCVPCAWKHAYDMKKIFSKSREGHYKRTGHLSTFASEMLGIINPLCHFLEMQFSVKMPLEVQSWCKLTIVMKLVGLAKMGHDIASDLEVALQEHADARIAAYGSHAVKPKFAIARLLPRQLERDKVLLDTFTPERHHSMAKEAAEPIDNTRRFERSVLSRFLLLQKDALLNWKMDGLVGSTVDWPDLASDLNCDSCVAALRMRIAGTLFGKGDIVFAGDLAYRVESCICLGSCFCLIAEPLEFKERVTSMGHRWLPTGLLSLLPIGEDAVRVFRLASVWSQEPSGTILILA